VDAERASTLRSSGDWEIRRVLEEWPGCTIIIAGFGIIPKHAFAFFKARSWWSFVQVYIGHRGEKPTSTRVTFVELNGTILGLRIITIICYR
jgi:hypothetical protein